MAKLQAFMVVICVLLHITPLLATNSTKTDCDPSHPSSCEDCICWDTIPAAIGDYTLNGIKIVFIELWNNFFTSALVWEWTFLYGVMLYATKYLFQRLYYPQLIKTYGNESDDDKLSENLKIEARSLTAASKFISFFAALSCVIRCQLLLRTEKMSDDNIWVSMYIPTPPEIDQLMDSLLGYFVVDTIYLLLYRRRWMYIVHHQVAFVGTITLKSFGMGAHIGIPIYCIADSTTIALNIMWFIEDRIKYLQFYKENGTRRGGKSQTEIQKILKYWDTALKIVQLLFAISFLYQRLWRLSRITLPWVYYLLNAHHANYFHKFICISQGMALLGTGYIWSWHIWKILWKAVSSLLWKTSDKIADASSSDKDTASNKQGVKHSKKEN